MTDNITLPREVVEKAIKAFENGCPPTCENGMVDSGGFHPWGQPALVPCPACLVFERLRAHLAAEQPKPEPVAWLSRDEARLALWKAINSREFGNPTDDKLILDHLRQQGLWIGKVISPVPPEDEALAAEQPKRGKDIVAGGEAGSGDIVFKGFIDSQSADSLGRIVNAIERLAAEQPKPEPVAWQERHFFPKVGEWTHWYDCRPRMADYPREQIEQNGVRYQWRPLYAAPPDAPTVKESLTHPGYVIGSHWLETAYSRVCAGEAEEEVLRDCGWRRCAVGQGLTQHCAEAEALRRDAERYRWLRERAWFQFEFEGRYGDSGETVQELDAAIDAAMGDKR